VSLLDENHGSREAIDDAAAGWFARQRAGDMTAAETESLEQWLDADPLHRAALDALYRAWDRAEVARHDPEILAWRERAKTRPYWPKLLAGRALAACLAVAVIGGGGAWYAAETGLLPGSGRFYDQTFKTDLGQRATFTLRDGSEVTLNTNTRLRTRAVDGQRLVYLDSGQAFFRVAKDASRPFVVKAGGRTITAIGTAFDVRVDPGRFAVTLVEGRVRVEAPAPASRPLTAGSPAVAPPVVVQTTEMTAGAQLVAASTADWSVRQADTIRETSWVSGRMMFDNERLGDVAAEFERYSERRVVFADAKLADVPITGTFRSGDLETFVRALEQYKVARVQSQTPDVVRLASY
jgi:transmembrane sensor